MCLPFLLWLKFKMCVFSAYFRVCFCRKYAKKGRKYAVFTKVSLFAVAEPSVCVGVFFTPSKASKAQQANERQRTLFFMRERGTSQEKKHTHCEFVAKKRMTSFPSLSHTLSLPFLSFFSFSFQKKRFLIMAYKSLSENKEFYIFGYRVERVEQDLWKVLRRFIEPSRASQFLLCMLNSARAEETRT